MAKAKDDLENYVNDKRLMLERHSDYTGRKERRKVGDVLEHVTQWLEWNTFLTEADKFEDKLKEIQNICDPILAKMQQQHNDSGASKATPKIEVVDLD
ncbi:Heat shock cognate 70 kDa protein 1 [Bienertia sinuspersici]